MTDGMISVYRRIFAATFTAAALALSTTVTAQYADVLTRPAQDSARAASTLLNGLVLAETRLIAVGHRGHIIYSDDQGRSWQQARVPVSSDLTAVYFPTRESGWAVGHDGVILHSNDAGESWQIQMDGIQAVRIMQDHYGAMMPADPEDAARLQAELDLLASEGPDKPFLDVWFENERTGFVVGTFGLAFRTEDGGRTWQPWYDRMDNPRGLHIYALEAVRGALYAVGEQGLVLKLDPQAERFRALETGYDGTYFGAIDSGDGAVLVFGLRGNAWRSADGEHDWRKIETGILGNINAGTQDPNGNIYLVSQTGQILYSRNGGTRFSSSLMSKPMSAGAVVVSGQTLIIAGRRGILTQPSAMKESDK